MSTTVVYWLVAFIVVVHFSLLVMIGRLEDTEDDLKAQIKELNERIERLEQDK